MGTSDMTDLNQNAHLDWSILILKSRTIISYPMSLIANVKIKPFKPGVEMKSE